ncbi:MAG: hypothetical protein ACRD72_04760, partial [Candidatus Angelobacter sp.]
SGCWADSGQAEPLRVANFVSTMGRNGKFENSLQRGKVVQWTVFENKQLAIGNLLQLAISQTTLLNPTPIES